MFRETAVFCCLCFLALAPYVTNAMTAEQREMVHKHFQQLGMECMKDNPIGEDDIKKLKSKQVPTGDKAPCFVACVMKKSGLMDDKGMLTKESALELAKQVFNDDEELKMIEDYLHSCAHINTMAVGDGEQGCERAIASLKCMNENASQFGFDL